MAGTVVVVEVVVVVVVAVVVVVVVAGVVVVTTVVVVGRPGRVVGTPGTSGSPGNPGTPGVPGVVVAVGSGTDDGGVPLLRDRPTLDGNATAYVCRGFVCERPTTDPDELARQLSAAVAAQRTG